MLNLAEDDEQQAVAEMARGLGLEVLSPAAVDTERERAVPEAVWTVLAETGLPAPLSEEMGGGGVPNAVLQTVAVENLAYGDAQATLASVWSGAAGFLISEAGTAAQRTAHADVLRSAAPASAVALYEASGGSPAEWSTSVRVEGDSVRVQGRKVAVAFGESAQLFVVIGADADTGELRGVIVPATGAGVSVKRAERNLAFDSAQFANVEFDVTTSSDALLDSTALALSVARLRLLVAAAQVGTAQRAVEFAAEYGSQRIAFGKPIVGFQGISFLLAQGLGNTAQARLEVLEAATLIDAGVEPERVARAVNDAVAFANESAAETTRNGVQVLGGHGFMTEYPAERWYRMAAFLSTLDFDPQASAFQPGF